MKLRGKGQGARVKSRRKIYYFFLVFGLWSTVYGLSGCGVTYPKEKFKESIIRVCKREYKLDVKVATSGNTVAIYVPLENLIDFTFSITKSASEKINDVILTVSRVTLSTDAKYEFYCVIAHDVRIPEIQIVIIKSVDDVKRFLLNDISRGEYAKRMIVDIRLSPQAQKERAIKEVFDKMSLDKKWQEDVMNDFFRSEPTGLGDIGYWNGHFYIKNITMGEFLAEQIASRIKNEFRDDKSLQEAFLVKSSKCAYVSKEPRRSFKLDLAVENRFYGRPQDGNAPKVIMDTAVKVASEVLHNYRFKDYEYVDIKTTKDRGGVKLSRLQIEAYKAKKKGKIEDFIDLGY